MEADFDVSFDGKLVIIGLGNPYMKDDGVGIQVAREMMRRDLGPEVVVQEHQALELSLLWQFSGASKILVVDALRSGGPPGTVSKYSIVPREGPLTELPNLHSLQLFDMFDLANQSSLLPCPVTIVGIEPECTDPGEGLTEGVSSAIPKAVESILEEV